MRPVQRPYLVRNGMPVGTGFVATSDIRYSLAGVWRFREDPDDAGLAQGWSHVRERKRLHEWRELTVPGSWNAAFADLAGYLGAGWYAVRFALPPEAPRESVRIRFEAAFLHTQVWLNGRSLGGHVGGYTPFEVDATEALGPGWNTLVVRVDNRTSPATVPATSSLSGRRGWFPYGGLIRDVTIRCGPATRPCSVDVEAHPSGSGSWRVDVTTGIWSVPGASVAVCGRVECPRGMPVASWEDLGVEITAGRPQFLRYSFEIPEPVVWDRDRPQHRYLVRVAAGDAWAEDEFGLRTVEARDGELLLNGRPQLLRGLDRREDHPVHGPVQAADVVKRDLDLLQRLGVTHVRPGHHPPDPAWLRALAAAGITVTEELPAHQLGARRLRDLETLTAARGQLIEMIERDRNEPAVLMWSVASENWDFLPRGRRFFEALAETARRYDATRPLTAASAAVPVVSDVLGLDFTAAATDVVSVQERFGWLHRRAGDAGRLLDLLHRRHPRKPVVVGGFGGEALSGRVDPQGGRDESARQHSWSEDHQAWLVEAHTDAALARPWVCGVVPAALADARTARTSGVAGDPAPGWVLDGVTSADREPKAAFDVLKHLYRREDLDR